MKSAPYPRWQIFLPWLIVLVGLTAYHNSLSGEFVFDDQYAIVKNSLLRQLWPPIWMSSTTRPFTNFTFALNYAFGGLHVVGYHLLNLSIHLFAALVLYGIVRRTLSGPLLKSRYGSASAGLALATALIWLVHPLQTESVTYIVQRAESLTGLFYLLTLYCVIRSVDVASGLRWALAAVGACALGMMSKPIMATAPLTVLLYDCVFICRSFAETLRRRWTLYLGLAATWLILSLLLSGPPESLQGAGFHIEKFTPAAYILTQPGVILHYLRLAFWPRPLCLDYPWPAAKSFGAIVPPALALTAAFFMMLWALRRKPALGFLGIWFFLILMPTSSFIPLDDPIAEHRMYLSLAALAVLAVVGGWELLFRFVPETRIRRVFSACAAGVLVAALSGMTIQRNLIYQNETSLWNSVLEQYPNSVRGHTNLGEALFRQGKITEAVVHYKEALRLKPDHANAHYNLGLALNKQGKFQEASVHYMEALRLRPGDPDTYNNLGENLIQQRRFSEAVEPLVKAVQLQPKNASAHNNLGIALSQQGQLAEAVVHYKEALRLKPDYTKAHNNLGLALEKQGKFQEASVHYMETLRLKPDDADTYSNLGESLIQQGRFSEAVEPLVKTVRLQPKNASAHNNLGIALSQQGQLAEAVVHYQEALQLEPNMADTHYNLGLVLAKQSKFKEAAKHFAEAVRLRPDDAEARRNLEAALAHQANP